MPDEHLTKVYIDLPNHWASGGESMWAAQLSETTFELRNVPFHAYGLNYLDVVEAVADAPDQKPRVRRVVRRSGHSTLRVILDPSQDLDDAMRLLDQLNDFGCSRERATKAFFALDIEPDGDIDAVQDLLEAWASQGILSWETCETRLEGTFDAQPEEDDGGAGRNLGG